VKPVEFYAKVILGKHTLLLHESHEPYFLRLPGQPNVSEELTDALSSFDFRKNGPLYVALKQPFVIHAEYRRAPRNVLDTWDAGIRKARTLYPPLTVNYTVAAYLICMEQECYANRELVAV
jgi:hypothetical protein